MKLMMSDKVYDVLKWIAIVFLPAIALFFNALAIAWQWDVPIEAIDATFAAVETLIGSLIGISTLAYNKEKLAKK